MRSLILVLVLSLAVASVLSKKGGKGGKGGKEEKGLCLTEDHMMMMCKAGTALGERTMAAMETCSGNAVAEGRAKKGKGKGKKPKPNKPNKPNKGKGKGKNKCLSVEKLEKKAMEEYAVEICVFQELGWMDSDMNEMEEVIQADIDTLPPKIAEALKGDPYAECLAVAEEKRKNMEKKYKHCEKKYDEEEKARLDELFTGIAETECFMHVFKKSCGSYVKENLSSILGGIMPAAGRK